LIGQRNGGTTGICVGCIDIKKIEFHAKPPSRKELNKAQEKNTCNKWLSSFPFFPLGVFAALRELSFS